MGTQNPEPTLHQRPAKFLSGSGFVMPGLVKLWHSLYPIAPSHLPFFSPSPQAHHHIFIPKKRQSLVVLCSAAAVAALDKPQLQWDPATLSPCADWVDNVDSSCQEVRAMFGLSPELFHAWNPSVGVDCSGWAVQSYCVMNQKRLDDVSSSRSAAAAAATKTSTAATGSSATTSSTSHVPSPTAWAWMGCYVARTAGFPPLNRQMTTGEPALRAPACEDRCWQASNSTVMYAGLTMGDQCWCGNFLDGNVAPAARCDVPCTGEKAVPCGGRDAFNIYKPITTVSDGATPAGTAPSSAAAASALPLTTTTATSAATKRTVTWL
ncbi:WSC domain-containing protein [Microdochium nivale]|nr:WSC domain-containing protein [Microdochium nivale]